MADKPPKEPEKESEHSTAEYANFAKPEKPIRNWTRIFSIFIIVVVVIGLLGGGYWFYKHHHKSSKPPVAKTTTSTTTPVAVTAPTKSYTSPDLFLTFSYPSDWTIVDSNGKSMTATSPLMQLKDVDGQDVSGKIVMTIENSATSLPGFTAGSNATAVIASQNIAYTSPTASQRANTYVSFLTYAATTSSNALDAIYISGNDGYTLGQAIPQSDLLQVSPIINLTFFDASGKVMSLSASDWNDTSFSTPLLDMLKSLSIT